MEDLIVSIFSTAAAAGIGLAAVSGQAEQDNGIRITQEDAEDILSDDNVKIIDVRSPNGWESADRKIKGAIRENPLNVDDWAEKYSQDDKLILYCS